MGTRNIKRQIAKARMKVIGIERINRRMKETNKNGVPNWKTALMDERRISNRPHTAGRTAARSRR
jgi:hypothetical protein